MLFANYSYISSIEHIDQTSRVQTVEENTGLFRKLLEKFYEKTNCPYLLNTSLNINGRPIIGNVKKLQNYFNNSDIDILVIGDEIWKK
jgi:carbamoyltransferase